MFAHLSLIYEGERPHQREPTSLHRRLWPHNYHWYRNSCCCWDIPDIVDLKRHTDVIYRGGDIPVDES